MSLPKICCCPVLPVAECPFHGKDAPGSFEPVLVRCGDLLCDLEAAHRHTKAARKVMDAEKMFEVATMALRAEDYLYHALALLRRRSQSDPRSAAATKDPNR